ncbi:hypothetical protein H8D29_00300 [PVC group bacterium]|nr:hypothetical protein [PVC group bacterium]
MSFSQLKTNSSLWASAVIVAALILMQTGRLRPGVAVADSVSSGEGFTLLTTSSGQGTSENPTDVLFVIDNHSAVIMVYEITNASDRKGFTPLAAESIPSIFNGLRRR